MEAHEQNKKFEKNQSILNDIAKELQGDALNSLNKVKGSLETLRQNMDLNSAIKMKAEFEKNGGSFDDISAMMDKLKNAAK